MLFYIGFGFVWGWAEGYRKGHKDGYQRGKAIVRHISQLVK
jgi:flagellar biosynthesis/type III secretory pathway protein FliH